MTCVVGLAKSAADDSCTSVLLLLATAVQRTLYAVSEATCPGAWMFWRSGGAHAGGVFKAANELTADCTDGQASNVASTNHRIRPEGTLIVSLASVVVPMMLASSSSTAAHTLYSFARATALQTKRTGETMPMERSGGEC